MRDESDSGDGRQWLSLNCWQQLYRGARLSEPGRKTDSLFLRGAVMM
jgi:hypothetical protein